MPTKVLAHIFAFIMYVIALLGIGYIVPTSDTYSLIAIYLILFIPYWYWAGSKKLSKTQIIVIGLMLRLLLLFSTTRLSDDSYRYFWDGTLLAKGYNPYADKPNDTLQSHYFGSDSTQQLLSKLNSQEYYTVYPPFSQVIFAVSAKLSGFNYPYFNVILRLIIILFELITCLVLFKILEILSLPHQQAIWYFLNPMVIIELTGNLHSEIYMIWAIALSLFLYHTQWYALSAVFLAFAVATKLYPILFVPFFMVSLPLKHKLWFGFAMTSTIAVLFLPFFYNNSYLYHVVDSLKLYYQNFEFNGGLYYFFRYIGFRISGYNQIALIGKILSFCTLSAFIILWLLRIKRPEKWTIEQSIFFAMVIFYLLSHTVMPWYLSLAVFATAFVSYRMAIAWSALSLLSYSAFLHPAFHEDLFLVAVEYFLLALFSLYEFTKHYKTLRESNK
ncbi:DUF2029 domain-containing protein [bacterium]|nr:DUF2029 domain-containing protein [bacterium]